jgi:hypothetical protein
VESGSYKKMINFFNIYDYRKFVDYVPINPEPSYKGNVLCIGTCDLYTIKPKNVLLWSWGQKLSTNYEVDILSRQCSIDWYTVMIKKYLEKNVPKIVCFTVPIYAESVQIENKIYTIHENSRRVLKFLKIKKVLSSDKYEMLDERVIKIINLPKHLKILKNIQYFKEFTGVLESYNIKWLWTFNATRTANMFYNEFDGNYPSNNYLGFVSNIDVLPESSIGEQTQNKLYKIFLKGIENYEQSS